MLRQETGGRLVRLNGRICGRPELRPVTDPFQETDHGGGGVGAADRRQDVECVLGIRELGVEDGGMGNGPEGFDETPGLGHGHEGVVGAVDDEEGRGVAVHPAQGGGLLEDPGLVVVAALENTTLEKGHEPLVVVTRAPTGGHVVDAVEGDAGVDGGGGVLETGLKGRVAGRESDHGTEMSTGGSSADGDEAGIAAVVGDVLADPAQGALAVDQMIGPRGPRTESVIDGDGHPAPAGQLVEEREPLLPLVTDDPRPAVDVDENGSGGGGIGPTADDVEPVTGSTGTG